MKKSRFTVHRIALNAVMAAMFVGLSFFSFIIAGVKVTVEDLPVVISAVVFGPLDAAIVGFLGEFINQMLTYGFTPTTLLWILPAVTRGLLIGFCLWGLKRRYTTEELFKSWRTVWIFAVSAIAGVLASVLNTLAYYVDSKMFGYFNYALVFGVFWIRIALGIAFSLAMAAVSIPVTVGLKKSRLIQ